MSKSGGGTRGRVGLRRGKDSRNSRSPQPAEDTGGRPLAQRVHTAKGRKLSSTRWLQRQLNDPFVAEARRQGYRSRAAFKLLQLDERFHLLKPGLRVVDLGAAPGGWSQIAVQRVQAPERGRVIALDIQEIEPVAGAELLVGDIHDPGVPEYLKAVLSGQADLVLSDMAAPSTGHSSTDHLRIIGLCEAAWLFAREVLAPGGAFVAKVLQGGTEGDLLASLKQDFTQVRHAKPAASRSDSAEQYVVATGFRGGPAPGGPDTSGYIKQAPNG